MNLGDVEHGLRLGPPEEDRYRVRELVLDDPPPTPAEAVQRGRIRWLSGGRPSRVAAGGLAIAASVVVAFAAGRLSAPTFASSGASPANGVRLQPAVVADGLRQAFYSGVRRDTTWLLCTAATSLDCIDVPAVRTSDTFGTDEWSLLRPGNVPAGDVIVGAQLDPVVPVIAFLVSAANPSAGGPQLVPVTIHPGDTFFDLGSLAPGRYVVSVLTDPTSPMASGQTVIGINVEE